MTTPKRIAFLIFPRLTFLDFIGGYDALRRVAAMGIDGGVSHRIIGTLSNTERVLAYLRIPRVVRR